MEELLALRNIGVQPMVDQNGLDITIIYTDDLLKKEVLIGYYKADLGRSEEETVVFAMMKIGMRFYTYILYFDQDRRIPLLITRLILDSIEYLSCCPKELLIDIGKPISISIITSSLHLTDQVNKRLYEMDSWKFDTALELIESQRNGNKS